MWASIADQRSCILLLHVLNTYFSFCATLLNSAAEREIKMIKIWHIARNSHNVSVFFFFFFYSETFWEKQVYFEVKSTVQFSKLINPLWCLAPLADVQYNKT